MHQKITLAILLIAMTVVAKGQTSQHDSVRSSERDILTVYQQGHVYKITSVNEKTIEMEVDDKRIAPADYHRYDSVVNAIKADLKEDKDHDREERAERQRDREEEERDRIQEERDREQEKRDRVQEEKNQEQERLNRKQDERNKEQEEKDRVQKRQNMEQEKRDKEQEKRDREQEKKDREQEKTDRVQESDRVQDERDVKSADEQWSIMRDLLNDLVAEKVVPDEKSLNTVVLTQTDLVVNGKKQGAELQQKIKAKYSNWAKAGLSYGASQAPGTLLFFSR